MILTSLQLRDGDFQRIGLVWVGRPSNLDQPFADDEAGRAAEAVELPLQEVGDRLEPENFLTFLRVFRLLSKSLHQLFDGVGSDAAVRSSLPGLGVQIVSLVATPQPEMSLVSQPVPFAPIRSAGSFRWSRVRCGCLVVPAWPRSPDCVSLGYTSTPDELGLSTGPVGSYPLSRIGPKWTTLYANADHSAAHCTLLRPRTSNRPNPR